MTDDDDNLTSEQARSTSGKFHTGGLVEHFERIEREKRITIASGHRVQAERVVVVTVPHLAPDVDGIEQIRRRRFVRALLDGDSGGPLCDEGAP